MSVEHRLSGRSRTFRAVCALKGFPRKDLAVTEIVRTFAMKNVHIWRKRYGEQ